MAMPGTPSGQNHSSESQKCGRKCRPARLELAVELGDAVLEPAALEGQAEVAHAQVEQPLVVPGRPLGRGNPRRRAPGAPC